jgi:transposase
MCISYTVFIVTARWSGSDGCGAVNGRQMAAALGLTPRQNSSGDKRRLLGISKRGDTYMRTQMIHGARSVVSHAKNRDDPLSRWATDISSRSNNVSASFDRLRCRGRIPPVSDRMR